MRRDRLAEARKAKGLTQEKLAEILGVERQTVSDWERGEATPTPSQRPPYADALGVSVGELAAMLTFMPQAADEMPDWSSTYLSKEQSARRMFAHEDEVIYGLLQTPAYVTEIARAVGVSGVAEEYVARNVEQRKLRQKRVVNGDVELDVIQAEAVLYVRLGDATVMAEQLHRMADLAELSNVTVRIFTFDAGQHAIRGLDTFTIMEHPWGNPSVFVEGYGGGRFVSNADEVAYFTEAFDQACKRALPPNRSVEYIRKAAEQWEARR